MDAPVLDNARDTEIFLGLEDGCPRFAVMIPDWEETIVEPGAPPFVDQSRQTHPDLPDTFAFGELRAVMSELSPVDSGNAAAARGIFAWHERHRFCANCGVGSVVDDAGWRRTCPACNAQHFPRTDPVVIMLIVHHNEVLLGRSPAWPEGMYSLLAGFMEPGESIEAAVRRETWEESSVVVGEVEYLSSQPWPFPSSLMIGCLGHALTTEITCDTVELEDAKWVSRETLLAAMHGGVPGLKPSRKGSIARFLLDRWLADDLR
jgi:NAD+ diphosphatase